MKRLVALVFVMILASCSTPELTSSRLETELIENSERRPETINCTETIIPDGVDRQLIIDRLNQSSQAENGNTPLHVFINYDKNLKAVMFAYLWPESVQYSFTITDERGNVIQDCITVTSNNSTFYSFNGRAGTYRLIFNGFPEVTREFEFEITRGR